MQELTSLFTVLPYAFFLPPVSRLPAWVVPPAIPSLHEDNIPVLPYDVGWKEGCTGASTLFLVPAISVLL